MRKPDTGGISGRQDRGSGSGINAAFTAGIRAGRSVTGCDRALPGTGGKPTGSSDPLCRFRAGRHGLSMHRNRVLGAQGNPDPGVLAHDPFKTVKHRPDHGRRPITSPVSRGVSGSAGMNHPDRDSPGESQAASPAWIGRANAHGAQGRLRSEWPPSRQPQPPHPIPPPRRTPTTRPRTPPSWSLRHETGLFLQPV